jgi:beta-xylosidase
MGGAGGEGATGGMGGAGGGMGQLVYRNPVLPGDFPDPSVIRVENDYWATATSSEWAPQYPLLHSTDLVNWDLVGPIFSEMPAWATANFWAPEISEDNGTYYVFYTAREAGGSLCVAAASSLDPAGPYLDHGPLVCQQAGSIDGFSIRDENDVRYLIWKEDGNSVGQPTPLWAQQLSDDGTELLGSPTVLFQNEPSWEANLVEGPFLLRHDNYFYAFYSGAGCCTTSCSYSLGVARAQNLLGPWEKNPANPILPGNDVWKCPGHGSIVTTPDGRFYLLYHAYSVEDSVYVGRQGLLDEVVFGADGWPTLHGGNGPSVSAPYPIAPQEPLAAEIMDDFTGASLGVGWQWPVGIKPQASLDPSGSGWLVLGAMPEGTGNHVGAAVARQTLKGDYEVTTRVEPDAGVAAGVSAYGDPENALGVSIGDGQILLWRLGSGVSQVIDSESAPSSLYVRMTASNGHVFRIATSTDGTTWDPFGPLVDSRDTAPDLPPWDRGVRVALFAKGPAGSSARFDFFRMTLPGVAP